MDALFILWITVIPYPAPIPVKMLATIPISTAPITSTIPQISPAFNRDARASEPIPTAETNSH